MPVAQRFADGLPEVARLLVVCAHPDDESFGLGAALSAWAERGASTAVACFTHGEASTLGAGEDLHRVRAGELKAAAEELGVASVMLFEHPDGSLREERVDELSAELQAIVEDVEPELLLVFDEGGITGHPDHVRATEVARAVATLRGLPVLGWTLPEDVAAVLRREFRAPFVGRRSEEIDLVIEVERTRQLRAIRCHASQAQGNVVLTRRLALQRNLEAFRWLSRGDS